MRSFNAVFAAMTLSVAHVAAQTTLLTEVQGGQTLVITEVISTVATQGATVVVEVKQAANGQTLTESIFVSPTEVKRVENVDSPTVQGQEVVDCKIPANGMATCVDAISAVENGQTVVSAATFMSQFPVAPSPSTPRSPAPQSPTPAPSPTSAPSANSANSPNSASPSAPSVIAAASSTSSGASASPTSAAANATSPSTTPGTAVLGTNATAGSSAETTTSSGFVSLPSPLADNNSTITSPLNPTNSPNATLDNGAMINFRPVGATVAFTFLGMILGMM